MSPSLQMGGWSDWEKKETSETVEPLGIGQTLGEVRKIGTSARHCSSGHLGREAQEVGTE